MDGRTDRRTVSSAGLWRTRTELILEAIQERGLIPSDCLVNCRLCWLAYMHINPAWAGAGGPPGLKVPGSLRLAGEHCKVKEKGLAFGSAKMTGHLAGCLWEPQEDGAQVHTSGGRLRDGT